MRRKRKAAGPGYTGLDDDEFAGGAGPDGSFKRQKTILAKYDDGNDANDTADAQVTTLLGVGGGVAADAAARRRAANGGGRGAGAALGGGPGAEEAREFYTREEM